MRSALALRRLSVEREGLAETVLRLAAFTVVSPAFTPVRLEPDGITMLDFRAPAFAPLEWLAFLAAPGWRTLFPVGNYPPLVSWRRLFR